MKKLNKYLYSFLVSIILLLLLILIHSILNYFELFNIFFENLGRIFIPIICIFIGSFLIGKRSIKKGYLEGIKFSLIFILLSLIFKLMVKSKFKLSIIIYYIIIVISSMFGSCFGISYKKGK